MTEDIVVLGAGVIGLTTAIELQRHGARVRIVARDLPEATTSAIAAAIWYPYLAEPRERVGRWSMLTFDRLCDLARDPATGVSIVRAVQMLGRGSPLPWWAASAPAAMNIDRLSDDRIAISVPLCDTRRYLPWLRDTFARGGGTLEQRALASLDEAFALARVVVNCTGLGARELCNDRDLVPVRGQVLVATGVALPHAWIDDRGDQPIYVVPRGDDAIHGGTSQRGDERTAADATDTARILADGLRAIPQLAQAAVRTAKVGLRPYRPQVRLERGARRDGGVLVHCYGHGGSGFTLAWGCAEEAAHLATS